jgi:ankyrin repeat protein
VTTYLQTLLPERHEGEVAARIYRLSGPDWYASTEEFLHICIFLISNNMDNDKLRQTLVSYLAEPSNKAVLSSLLSLEGTTMQMFKERLFIMAVSNNNSQLVIELLRRNTNPNIRNVESGQTALQSCVLNGNIELCRALLAAGADVNAEPAPARLDGTALQMAARQLRLDITLLLLEHRADVNATGNGDNTALEIAVLWPLVNPNVELCNTSTIVQALLSAGTSLSGKGYPHTSSSLSEALNRDLRPIVRVLLESSTDLDTIVADGLGRTLLQKALETKNIDLVAEVWSYGCINSQLRCRAMEDLENPNNFLDFCGVTALARLEELNDSDTIMLLAYEAALLFEPQKAREFWTSACSNLVKRGNLKSFLVMLVAAHKKGQEMVPGLDLARIGALEDLDDRSKFTIQAAARLTNVPVATCIKNTICHQPRKEGPECSDILASVEIVQSWGVHGNSRWLNISLSIAVCIDNLDLVKDFILKGADVNASVKSGGCSTALYEAVNSRNLQAIERSIFSRGGRSTSFFEQPKTLLQVAATNKNTELVECLITAGADIDADVGYSPLNISFHNGDVPTFEVLVDAGADLKSLTDGFWPRTTIFSASERRDFTNIFKMLASHDLVLVKTAVGNWLLHEAAISGDLKLMRWLIRAGANMNTLGGPGQVPSTLLQKVIARKPQKETVLPGSPRVVKGMLSGLLDKPLGDALLGQGTHQTSTDMVKLLVEGGADINAFYWENENSISDITFKPKNIFQLAASNGNLEIMKFLLDAGSDMNALPAAAGGRTALQAAAEKGHGHIVKFLIEAGADVNEGPAEFGGRTALQLVASKGFLGLAVVLLEAGADPNADDDIILGMTALECAAKWI